MGTVGLVIGRPWNVILSLAYISKRAPMYSWTRGACVEKWCFRMWQCAKWIWTDQVKMDTPASTFLNTYMPRWLFQDQNWGKNKIHKWIRPLLLYPTINLNGRVDHRQIYHGPCCSTSKKNIPLHTAALGGQVGEKNTAQQSFRISKQSLESGTHMMKLN